MSHLVRISLLKSQLRKHGRIVVTTRIAGDNVIRIAARKDSDPMPPDPKTPKGAPIAA